MIVYYLQDHAVGIKHHAVLTAYATTTVVFTPLDHGADCCSAKKKHTRIAVPLNYILAVSLFPAVTLPVSLSRSICIQKMHHKLTNEQCQIWQLRKQTPNSNSNFKSNFANFKYEIKI